MATAAWPPSPRAHRTVYLTALTIFCLLGAALAGCGGGKAKEAVSAQAVDCSQPGGGPVVAQADATNSLLITRDNSLFLRDMKSGKETKLCSAPEGLFVTYPAWSPDGKQYIYALDSPFIGNVAANWGSDFYLADASGGNRRLLLKHEQPGVELESPSWMPDGKTIVYSYFLTKYDAQGQYQGQTYEARAIDAASGAVTTIAKDANSTDLCRDGSKLTYVNFNDTDFTSYGIWVADANGQNGKAIVNSSTGMQAFFAPRFSPDCKQIIFAAVGGGIRQIDPAPKGGGNLLTRLLAPLLPASASAHGAPWDLWLVNVDGSGLKRITNLNEDLPFLEWAADGQSVVFVGTNGLYQMSPDGANIKKIGQGAVHGQISWFQRSA